MEKLMSMQEVADRLGVSFWTVYRISRSGQLPSVRIGRRRLFAAEDLERLIRETRERTAETLPKSRRANQ